MDADQLLAELTLCPKEQQLSLKDNLSAKVIRSGDATTEEAVEGIQQAFVPAKGRSVIEGP